MYAFAVFSGSVRRLSGYHVDPTPSHGNPTISSHLELHGLFEHQGTISVDSTKLETRRFQAVYTSVSASGNDTSRLWIGIGTAQQQVHVSDVRMTACRMSCVWVKSIFTSTLDPMQSQIRGS
jgi:hypothetical protein